METRVIDFYDDFKCLGGACPYTCCSGWAIAVDDYTYEHYKKEPGLMGKALLGFTKRNKNGIRTIRTLAGRCPYHTKNGLCRHERDGKRYLMPYACRHYPRRSVSYWEYSEVTLELSCIKVAEIFVNNLGRRKIVPLEELPEELANAPVMWNMGINEPAFLKQLIEDREKLLNNLWERKDDFCNVVRDIYEFVYVKNLFLANDNLVEFARIELPIKDEESVVPVISGRKSGYAFFPVWFVNKLIYTKLLREDFKTENAFMKSMVKDYESIFGNLTEKEADNFFNNKVKLMYETYPKLRELFISYYSYLIQQSYCESYEDYYVLGPVLLSIVQLQFLMEFFVCAFIKGKRIDDKLMSEIIANTEKTIRHNLHFNDYILSEIRKVFF